MYHIYQRIYNIHTYISTYVSYEIDKKTGKTKLLFHFFFCYAGKRDIFCFALLALHLNLYKRFLVVTIFSQMLCIVYVGRGRCLRCIKAIQVV